MKYPNNIREEELKNKVGQDWFAGFDTTQIIGNIDFSVFPTEGLFKTMPLLWAEAKKGDYNIIKMFVQLILTIGKERTFNKMIPPTFLGAFDCTKIAFLPYNSIDDVFTMNDFNWNVTPSNHETKEFQLLKTRIENNLQENTYTFNYLKDEKQLHTFIKQNVLTSNEKAKQTITKDNFFRIYLRWLDIVKPIIKVDWNELKKHKILDCDFYLADLFVDDKGTENIDDDTAIADNLFVIFEDRKYKIRKENLKGLLFDQSIEITNKKAYQNFWKLYRRPPHESFHDYIMQRRELLVPQDIREYTGAYFTPQQWVALSQQYLTNYLGENWQDEYYIWDCAAGTGNLLVGLTNKYNIYASTLDPADVNVMHERITHGANLLNSHVFQFDFLNDGITEDKNGNLISSLKDCEKIPQSLRDILSDPEKTKKLIIYINPPYAEGDNIKGKGRKGVHISLIHNKYQNLMGEASSELFAQFLMRIYKEIPNCQLANFSTLKNLQAPNFSDFRKEYRAKLEKIFLVPAKTFDNVDGSFPISFQIWNTTQKETFTQIEADVYNKKSELLKPKCIAVYNRKYISQWLETLSQKISTNYIGHLASVGNDFQNQRMCFIDNKEKSKWKKGGRHTRITPENLIPIAVYLSARHCIPATWLNDRDQFFYPEDTWLTDKEFQTNCLIFTLFHSQNNVSSREGANYWIPFTEEEVNAPEKFENHFMSDFLKGKFTKTTQQEVVQLRFELEYPDEKTRNSQPQSSIQKINIQEEQMSPTAKQVWQIAKFLWQYYLSQPNINVNASFYDIKEYFKGRDKEGKMNKKSNDEQFNNHIKNLNQAMKTLTKEIEIKVYQHKFLL